MTTRPELYPSQQRAVNAIVHGLRHGAIGGKGTSRGVLLASEQGTGKTPMSIETVNAMGYQRILVLCQDSLRFMWAKRIREWQRLGHPIYHIQAEALDVYGSDFLAKLAYGWVILNYDIAHRVDGLKSRPWDLVICDEAVALKSYNARRTTAVIGGAFSQAIPTRKWLMLSGNFAPNRIEEISAPLETVDPDRWNFQKLVDECYAEVDSIEDGRVIGTLRPGALTNLQHKLRQTVLVRLLKEDVLKDLPPKTYADPITVRLPSGRLRDSLSNMLETRRRLYAQLFNEKDPAERASIQAHLRGLEAAICEFAGTSSYRINAVVEWLLGQKDKVVVFAYHRDAVQDLVHKLRRAGRAVEGFTGENTKDAQDIVERFQDEKGRQFLVCNMQVGGVGHDLFAANLVVFAELNFSNHLMSQSEDRVHRIGQKRPVTIMHFVLEPSLDWLILDRMKEKREIGDLAFNPHKPHPV
jgi:SWI/SNF-related matrix-associated actin-dependent regulator 1 of chromatin subfamily A